MEAIFHEKQEGSLCAQHCLNALLQGPYFTPVDLGTLAQQMDDEERKRMAECGEESEEYRRFLQQPSGNMDDSGYFSVQVISSALEVWGLELVPYSSTDARAKEALNNPSHMQAFICNYHDHWFTIRRLGNQWFNLNSLLSKPELISDTYLALYLAQLKKEGYSIFVVFGTLPDCDADRLLKIHPAVRTPSKKIPKEPSVDPEEDPELAAALKLSLAEDELPTTSKPPSSSTAHNSFSGGMNQNEETDLQRALRLSLQDTCCTNNTSSTSSPSNSTKRTAMNDTNNVKDSQSNSDSEDEAKQLEKAIRMSLECKSNTPSAPSSPCDTEDVRNRRMAFLNRLQPNT